MENDENRELYPNEERSSSQNNKNLPALPVKLPLAVQKLDETKQELIELHFEEKIKKAKSSRYVAGIALTAVTFIYGFSYAAMAGTGAAMAILALVALAVGGTGFGITTLTASRLEKEKGKLKPGKIPPLLDAKYRKSYRETLIPAVLEDFFPEINYDPKRIFSLDEFLDLGLLAKGKYHKEKLKYACYAYFTKDSSAGTTGLAFVKLTHTSTKYNAATNRTEIIKETLFEGAIYHIYLQHHIQARTLLTTKKQINRSIKNFEAFDLESELGYQPNTVRFYAYTSRQTHTYEVVTQPVLDFLYSLDNRYLDHHPIISIHNQHLYLVEERKLDKSFVRPGIEWVVWSETKEQLFRECMQRVMRLDELQGILAKNKLDED